MSDFSIACTPWSTSLTHPDTAVCDSMGQIEWRSSDWLQKHNVRGAEEIYERGAADDLRNAEQTLTTVVMHKTYKYLHRDAFGSYRGLKTLGGIKGFWTGN